MPRGAVNLDVPQVVVGNPAAAFVLAAPPPNTKAGQGLEPRYFSHFSKKKGLMARIAITASASRILIVEGRTAAYTRDLLRGEIRNLFSWEARSWHEARAHH